VVPRPHRPSGSNWLNSASSKSSTQKSFRVEEAVAAALSLIPKIHAALSSILPSGLVWGSCICGGGSELKMLLSVVDELKILLKVVEELKAERLLTQPASDLVSLEIVEFEAPARLGRETLD